MTVLACTSKFQQSDGILERIRMQAQYTDMIHSVVFLQLWLFLSYQMLHLSVRSLLCPGANVSKTFVRRTHSIVCSRWNVWVDGWANWKR